MHLNVVEVARLSEVPWSPGSKLVHVKGDQKWPDDLYSDEGYHVELNAPLSLRRGDWVVPRGVYAVVDYQEEVFNEVIKVRRYIHETNPLFLKTVRTVSKAIKGD